MLTIVGHIFILKMKIKSEFLFYVSVEFAIFSSMLNVAWFYNIIFGNFSTYPVWPPSVHVNVRKHFLGIFSLNMEEKRET